MRDRLGAFPVLRIFSQNVNRNYGYMDSLLASLYDEYDLLLIQEPPWRSIRTAPSSVSRDGEEVIGHPINPNWGSLIRHSGLESPPRVAVYFNVRIAALCPAYRRDLIDDRDILLFSLGIGSGTQLYANIYSDTDHSAVRVLYEHCMVLPRLHMMCGDFNIRHVDWDPKGPANCVHADRLVAAAEAFGLTLSFPVLEGPTHFPYNQALTPTVIDLMFVPAEASLCVEHEILAEARGTSDHAPLTIALPGPDSEVPVTRWAIKVGSDEEAAYRGAVLDSLEPLLEWQGQTPGEIDVVVQAIASAFSRAWDSHAKEKRRGKHSNGWFTQACADSLAAFRDTRLEQDWRDYRRIMREAKREFFEKRIHEVATTNQRTWDLMAWARKRNLPTHEAISFRGVPCNSLESLWDALDKSYNAASNRQVDLSFLDPVLPLPPRQWFSFSELELQEALKACARNSAPGPDHVTWAHLKFWCNSPRVVALFTRIADACITAGHWPSHFKESLSVIIPKPGKPNYSTPKSFRPIVLLNTLGKLVEKMLARRLQFDGVAHGAFEPNQFGGIAQHSTEDAGVYLTHLVRAGWAKGLQTSVVVFDIAQFFPSLNHEVLLEVISRLGFPAVLGDFF